MQANQIAQTILAQLGGRKFIAMTGSKHFLALKDGLRFALTKNITSANRCSIILTPQDTYSVSFYRQQLNKNNLSIKNIAFYQDVYADQLQDIFTAVTGLYTSLGTLEQKAK